MAIKGNKSSDEVVKQYKKYEGISIMKVVAVNPNKEELATFGINVENDPVYVGKDKENIDMAYIDFYVQYKISDTEKPITRIDRFFIKDKKVKSTKNDGMQWVDKYGNQLWQANKPTATDIANKKLELKWFQFDADSARNAYEGEVELYDFISIWLNLKREDEISLDKIIRIECSPSVLYLWNDSGDYEEYFLFTGYDDEIPLEAEFYLKERTKYE